MGRAVVIVLKLTALFVGCFIVGLIIGLAAR